MPRKYSKKSQKSQKSKTLRKKSRKQLKKQSKKAGMFKSLKKMVYGESPETKLYDDIFDLLKYNIPRKDSQKKSLADFILKKNEKKNERNPNYKFKSELYKISNKISMLDLTNPNKLPLLSALEKTLNKLLGMYTSRVMAKLSSPALKSSRNNVELADAFANIDLSNARGAYNNALTGVNTRLRTTNNASAAFVNPRSLTTTTTNNGWEQVNISKPNENDVNELMRTAELQAELNRLTNISEQARMNRIQRRLDALRKGGYRKIKKSMKRVYA